MRLIFWIHFNVAYFETETAFMGKLSRDLNRWSASLLILIDLSAGFGLFRVGCRWAGLCLGPL